MSIARYIHRSLRFLQENSLFLILGTVAALVWANVHHASYEAMLETPLFGGGHGSDGHGEHPTLTVHFLVQDVLMCFFFASATKEIWEALLPGGALSSARKAATPLLATLGGVAGPALLYVAGAMLLGRPELVRGWAVPCATDIAFSYLVARVVFGSGHPAIPFLLLLAIADDAAGLAILAVAYPQGTMDLVTFALFVAAAIGFNLGLRRFGVQSFWAYLVVAGPLSWWGFYQGGIHAALALVPIIPTLPHATHDEGFFVEQSMSEAERPKDPLNQFGAFVKLPVELILFAFGLANAGVAVGWIFSADGATLGAALVPTVLVVAGLLLGKPLGIMALTLLALFAFRLELPRGMSLRDTAVLGVVAGIGFTVALFVSVAAFPPGTPHAQYLDSTKLGALLSFLAAPIAIVLGRALAVRPRETAEGEKPASTIASVYPGAATPAE